MGFFGVDIAAGRARRRHKDVETFGAKFPNLGISMGARVENIEMMRHVALSLIFSSISIMHYLDPKKRVGNRHRRINLRDLDISIYRSTNHDFVPAKNTNIPPLITTTNR